MMRRRRAAGVLTGLLLSALLFAASEWTVQVSSTKVRKDPRFWAPSLSTVRAGEKVTEVGRKGGWVEVTTETGARGWLHSSAVTRKEIRLSGGSTRAERGVSADEISLAGKGFTEEVEQEYKKKNSRLDFAGVDRIEGLTVSDGELEAFLREGGLAEWGRGK